MLPNSFRKIKLNMICYSLTGEIIICYAKILNDFNGDFKISFKHVRIMYPNGQESFHHVNSPIQNAILVG